jgi:hypothetical protein
LLGLSILVGVGGVLMKDFLVELWWFDAIGYEGYFWQRLLYRYLVFIAAVAFFFALFFANFWIGGKYLGARPPADDDIKAAAAAGDDRPSRPAYRRFQKRSLALYLPLTLVLAVVAALPLFFYWEQALMWLFAPDAGVSDPVFGNDVSFYLFSLPIYLLLYSELMVALVVVLLGLGLMYWAEHRAMPRRSGRLRRGARVHLSLLVALLFVMGGVYFVGDAFMLLYTDAHQPLFYGPGYEQMVVTLPLIGACALLLLVAGALLVVLVNTGRGAWALAATTVLFAAVLGVRHTPFVTDAVNRYVVTPNEMTREAPYIANSIDATLAAYRLQDVETREYPVREKAWEEITPEIRLSLQNVPIWDDEDLVPVYRELQEIRPYYAFDSVDIGRYRVDGVYQQVFLAARQIDLDELSGPRRTWVNRWLKYTHGYGAVMTPAAQPADAPIEWFIQGIPPSSVAGLAIDEPAIYYGTGGYGPVIAPNASHELDYASRDQVKLTDYRGDGGVPLGSLFRKLVFSLYFGERNILYTTQTTDDSRLLFRRDIRTRIRALTPELILDPDPYLVVADGRLYWIQDAYTASQWYPYAQPYAGHVEQFERPFNYMRDSVKVVVDAYDGSVDYYLADPEDPIAMAHARIYPGLFKAMEAMPQALKEHVRYPRSLFDVQMDIYARYHQTDPQTFYNQEDAWERPIDQWRDDAERMTAYYLTLNLIEPDRFEYSLFAPMSPLGQPNMRALAIAGSDGDNYGRIVVYNFPKGDLVYGPGQVNAFIKQDPRITQELTLWNQQGSQAERGRMVVVPVEGVVTYIQGVFLQSTEQSPMPQLARIIVSQGRLVVMESSLEEGIRSLHQRIKQTQQDEPAQKLPPPDRPPAVTEGDAGGSGPA